VGVVQTLEEVVHDEQLLANNILVPVQGAEPEVRTVNSPMQVIGAEKVSPRRAPESWGSTPQKYCSNSAFLLRR